MANLAQNVRVGAPEITPKGYGLFAPLGTTTPTTLTDPLDVALNGMGYISEEGLQRSISTETEDIRDWNLDVVRKVTTETNATYTLTLIQDDAQTARLLFGDDNVTEGTGGEYTIHYKGDTLPHQVFVFLMKDGDNATRVVINDGQITNVGDTTFVKNGVVSYEVTIQCYRDADGDLYKEIKKDGAAQPAA